LRSSILVVDSKDSHGKAFQCDVSDESTRLASERPYG
jgi:hypothetical protein